MKIYWSSKNIPELAEYSFQQKLDILHIAKTLYTPVEKLIINILKLLILIPPFILIARLDSWYIAIPILGIFITYFLVLQPIALSLALKHLPQALKKHNAINEKAS